MREQKKLQTVGFGTQAIQMLAILQILFQIKFDDVMMSRGFLETRSWKTEKAAILSGFELRLCTFYFTGGPLEINFKSIRVIVYTQMKFKSWKSFLINFQLIWFFSSKSFTTQGGVFLLSHCCYLKATQNWKMTEARSILFLMMLGSTSNHIIFETFAAPNAILTHHK